MDLLTADVHWSAKPRDSYRLRFLRETLPALAHKYDIDRLILAGDLTDEKDHHSAWLVNQIVDGLAKLARPPGARRYSRPRIIILQGQHDYKAIENPFFRFLSNMEGIRFIDRPYGIDGVLYMPHTRDYMRDWKDGNYDDVDLIITHNSFVGAEGVFDGIPLNALPKIPIVSGDIHIPQTYKNLTYVGAPYLINFGDQYEPRVLLLKDNRIVDSISVSGPQKRLIETGGRLDDVIDAARSLNKGDICQFKIRLDAEDKASWSEIRASTKTWAEQRGYIVHGIIPVFEGSASPKQSMMKETERKTDKQKVDDFVKAQGVDKLTAKVGHNFLEEPTGDAHTLAPVTSTHPTSGSREGGLT